MKNLLNTAVILLIAATPVLNACSNAPEGDKATIAAEQRASEARGTRFIVDTVASRIRFTGHGVGKNHPGTFRLSGGNVSVAGNDITAGDFIINIQSLELDQKGEMFDKKLRPHLMSGDFFDANKFRTARFEITGVQPFSPSEKDTSIVKGANYLVSGNFTLRDVTKNITFPARIDLDDNALRAKGNFDIDRTEWNMNYGNDKTLGDKFISEKVNIELDLQARRQ